MVQTYKRKKNIAQNYYLKMSSWASPSKVVHHLRYVVGDNNDGMIIYRILNLRYIILYRFLSNVYIQVQN